MSSTKVCLLCPLRLLLVDRLLLGGPELLEILRADAALMANPSAKTGIEEMGTLFTYLDAFQVIDKLSFDMSLARGLDYYTGIIYEAVVEASAPPGFVASSSSAPADTPAPPKKEKEKKAKKAAASADEEEEVDESQVGVGSIAAGGRYDNLVGMFTAAAAGEGKKAAGLPCVGVSIGLDRIFALVWPKWAARGMRSKETMAYVIAVGSGLLPERMSLVKELREAGIKVCSLGSSWALWWRLTADDAPDGFHVQGQAQAPCAVHGRREG